MSDEEIELLKRDRDQARKELTELADLRRADAERHKQEMADQLTEQSQLRRDALLELSKAHEKAITDLKDSVLVPALAEQQRVRRERALEELAAKDAAELEELKKR